MEVSDSSPLIERDPPAPPEAGGKNRGKWVWLVGLALAGALVGYFGATLIDDLFRKPDGAGAMVLIFVALPLVWLVVVGWHELGHVVGGWSVGGRFMLWVVGPIMLHRTPEGLRLSRNRSVNLGGGLAVCTPTELSRVTPARTSVMILGGPFFSLLLPGLIGWLLAGPLNGLGALGYNLLALIAVVSALIFIVTLAPFMAGGFKSDGRRAWDLLKGDVRSDQEAAFLLLTTSALGGVRPADYDPALVEKSLALGDGSIFDLYARVTVFYHHADRGEWTEAQARLDEAIAGEDQLVPYLRDVVRCEYAWLLATRSARVDLARAWLDSAGKLDFDPATRLRAEAAVALAEGNPEAAAEKVVAAQHALVHRSISPVRNLFAESALRSLSASLSGLVD